MGVADGVAVAGSLVVADGAALAEATGDVVFVDAGEHAGSANTQPTRGTSATSGKWEVTSCEPSTAFSADEVPTRATWQVGL
ncbi:MAG: hypothetical protein KDB60_19350 [Propionibacteriaceae bacterium]|nr:hypothetical protein [Propionibacteriaceae bacterium]